MKCKKTVVMFCSAFALSCSVPALGYAMNGTADRPVWQRLTLYGARE
ncbi:hypothetical protein AGMMS49592_5320 [Endomicrobiia bacterium]|nr:hypothetical protein AGMMS49592_5320 [Endomicrobiia bacterium]